MSDKTPPVLSPVRYVSGGLHMDAEPLEINWSNSARTVLCYQHQWYCYITAIGYKLTPVHSTTRDGNTAIVAGDCYEQSKSNVGKHTVCTWRVAMHRDCGVYGVCNGSMDNRTCLCCDRIRLFNRGRSCCVRTCNQVITLQQLDSIYY